MSAMALAAAGWQTPSPAVYLDQWVWIRFARVLQGSPQEASDEAAFATAAAAARRGIQFPLSTTHYEETLRITNHRQRRDLVNVMAPITNMCTLRKQGDLVRHQLLVALHETVGRPTFRPTSPWVLRRGVSWAFQGVERELRVLSPDGNIQPVDPAWLKQVWQWFEAEMLAGPAADDLPVLHTSGYISPRELETPGNRLEWEQDFAKHLAELSPRPPRAELRIWFLARELMHEYMDDLSRILSAYRQTFESIAGGTPGEYTRQRAVEFAERVPSLRIAAEMKLEIFRNPSRPWTLNMVRDIDAISHALPYCRVLVIDRDAAALLRRSDAVVRHRSVVVHDLRALPATLDQIDDVQSSAGDAAGWDRIGRGAGNQLEAPKAVHDLDLPDGCRVRLCGPTGPLADHSVEVPSVA